MPSRLVLVLVLLSACGPAVRVADPVNARGAPLTTQATCEPTDQDQFVYRPGRLQIFAACVHITGTVVSMSTEADGDIHLNLRLDTPYEGLLTRSNLDESGFLIIEPVCEFPPPQAEAIRICASDAHPLSGGLPAVGEHVFMEGRYVLDLQHHAWAELHPLYRWGTQ